MVIACMSLFVCVCFCLFWLVIRMSLCVVFWIIWVMLVYVVFCSILFWLDARCACASVERQLYANSWLRWYVWLRVYLSYVSACCILFYCVLFGCTVRMCDCCEAVVWKFVVAIVFMAQSLTSGVVAILDCVMAFFYRISLCLEHAVIFSMISIRLLCVLGCTVRAPLRQHPQCVLLVLLLCSSHLWSWSLCSWSILPQQVFIERWPSRS